jgi:hypothetical protein
MSALNTAGMSGVLIALGAVAVLFLLLTLGFARSAAHGDYVESRARWAERKDRRRKAA